MRWPGCGGPITQLGMVFALAIQTYLFGGAILGSMVIAKAIITTLQSLDLTATLINGQALKFRTDPEVMGLRAHAHPLFLGRVGRRLSVQAMHVMRALVGRKRIRTLGRATRGGQLPLIKRLNTTPQEVEDVIIRGPLFVFWYTSRT